MRSLMTYVWILTLISNVVLSLFLVGRQFYIRFGWLTMSTILAVAVDALLYWCHTYNHHLFEPLRLFIFYCLFWLLNVMVIWESWKLGEWRVRIPVEIQLGLALGGLLAHHVDLSRHITYYLECFARGFNLVVVAYFIIIFSRENTYNMYN